MLHTSPLASKTMELRVFWIVFYGSKTLYDAPVHKEASLTNEVSS